MRVLVCRPVELAGRTADALRALGHDPVIAPVTRIERIPVELPAATFDAVALTSSNAVVPAPSALACLPLFPVGRATAEAAVLAGWRAVQPAARDASELAEMILVARPRIGCLLYLAGEPRKPVLESRLAAAGVGVQTLVTYRAVPADIPLDIWDNPPNVALHYSRASAERFVAAAAGRPVVLDMWQCCLSADVAGVFAGLATTRILVAADATEASLFATLHLCHGQAGAENAP